MTDPIVIIGAGHAGVRAAQAMRKNSYAGDIIMLDAEADLLPYERPPLSKWDARNTTLALQPIMPAEAFDALNVALTHGAVQKIDREARTVHVDSQPGLRYSKLLLATGAGPRRMADGDAAGAFYLRTAVDAKALRMAAVEAKSAIVIGGGFIGLEVASSLNQHGIEVSVIEAGPALLTRVLTARTAEAVLNLHERNGVRVVIGAGVAGMKRTGQETTVSLTNGIELHADMIVVGIGSIPNVELARSSDLAIDNGIIVDSQMRTSDPYIFAAGDNCAVPVDGKYMRFESWHVAGLQGEIAGANMAIEKLADMANFTMVPWFWSQQYGSNLQVAGMRNPDDTMVRRRYPDGSFLAFGVSQSDQLRYVECFGEGTSLSKDFRLAMKMIAAGKAVDLENLADPAASMSKI